MSTPPDGRSGPPPGKRVRRARPATAAGGSPPPRQPPPRARPEGGARPESGRRPQAEGRPQDDRTLPYRTYRSAPQGLVSRLRGESDSEVGARVQERERSGGGRGASSGSGGAGSGGPGGRDGRGFQDGPGRRRLRRRRPITPFRVLRWVVGLIVFWLALSLVLFVISAENHSGDLPKGLQASLTGGGAPMLIHAQNVLVLGLDNRPTSGPGSKEPGSNYNELAANTDSIMIWRVGGGVSRKLSIPRDTLVNVPGLGEAKINAAWSQSPALTVKVVEQLTGVTINHVIVVDLSNFAKFIDDIGGVTVTTGRICSTLAGGAADGGFSLNLSAGTHHLSGLQALTLARTRDNSCDPAYNDLNREAAQQQILNAIKSQLFSVHAFLHLPWASWDAPGVIQTDMGAPTLLQLFVSSEIGGSPKPALLSEADSVYNGQDVLIPNAANIRQQVNALLNG